MNRALRRHHARRVCVRRNATLYYRHGDWFIERAKPWQWRNEMGRSLYRTPGWHRHEFEIQPARAETHRLEHHIVRGISPDLVLWPDYARPQDYYW